MDIFSFLLYLLIFYGKSSQSMKVLPELSPEDCQDIFGTTDQIKLPTHEFVRISHDTSNSEKYVKFFVFKEMVELRLQKSTLFSRKTPILLASTNKIGVIYSHLRNDTLGDALDFYEDPTNKAGISIKKDSEGKLEFIGFVRDLIVKKLTPKLYHIWNQHFSGYQHHREARNSKFNNFTDYHIVINRSISDGESINFSKRLQEEKIPRKKKYPFQLYFRTLIFVNYKEHQTLYDDGISYKLLIYLVCFWNTVNMLFNDFRNPSIKLHITGIVIRNQTAPYLEDFMWIDPKNEYNEQSMSKFTDFLKKNDPMPGRWDIAVSQSDIPLNSKRSTLGLAYIGTSCSKNNFFKFSSLALIFDKRDFAGVEIAAHEIGHLLGAHHDGENSSRCNDDGFIMSTESEFPYNPSLSWSICSQMEIVKQLRNRTESCWAGTPSIDEEDQIPKLLPGHITGLQDQCKLRGFDYACDEERTTCKSLFCWSESSLTFLGLGNVFEKCKDAGPPLPGTYCGEYMHCKNEICVNQTIV